MNHQAGKEGGFSRGHGVLPFRLGRTSFKLAVTSSNQFLPVVVHDLKGIAWLVASLQIWNSNNADVLLNSGLNLFDIMANLCSKLYYKVLLKSWNYIVYLLKHTSALDFNKKGCVGQIWVDQSSLLVLPTRALNYYIQKWKGLYQAVRKQTLYI